MVIKYFTKKVNDINAQKHVQWDYRAPKLTATAKVQSRMASDLIPEENS